MNDKYLKREEETYIAKTQFHTNKSNIDWSETQKEVLEHIFSFA